MKFHNNNQIKALVYSDNDVSRLEAALRSVEPLCNLYHTELEEICVDLLKVILHKSAPASGVIADFDELRLNGMICITTHYPKECALYLTSQFYEREYSFAHRTDMLQVLVISIQKLSDPNEDVLFDKRLLESDKTAMANNNLLPVNQLSIGIKSDWQEIVKKRVNAKTKIKSSSNQSVQRKQKENKYSNVFGYFFFSLINTYDQ